VLVGAANPSSAVLLVVLVALVKNMVFYSSPFGVLMLWQYNFKNIIFCNTLICPLLIAA
jgi:hypothetical protein